MSAALALTRAPGGRRNWALAAAALLLAAAVWMPPLMLPRNVVSTIVTFDITQSMDVEDVGIGNAPVSRLEFARAAMRDTLERLPCGSRIGWSIFTGQGTLLLMPPVEVCGNFDALQASLDGIGGDMRWTNWSRIAEGGVFAAVRTAKTIGHETGVLLITDGQEAPPVLADEPVRDVPRGQVKGWLIGVGGDQPAPIPRTNADGRRVGYWQADQVIQVPAHSNPGVSAQSHEELSALRGEYLASVAQQIGFDYRRLRTPQDLFAAMTDRRYTHRDSVPTDINWLPAALALMLLTWRFLPQRNA
ncbi:MULTISPECIES: vWA domain-containing protein [unclassified Caballeronia]|uniref:vWA domain-containing protein n=1 Tax=unclassified Caballeronia TaxID=2646786 RepID=UPI0028582462|nr:MULTISPECIES: vWA domain-containing protein [unclassified Caballeronia]MDR5816943.1 VWA domain-containing protein [Caballeronia sp. LZ033]MDR5823851.1 VWA domain-containing protein [Caballeronia sp. LZ043]MDR5881748.1 VWA domain-containing protein [Caballeronia sp. LZ032]